MEKALSSSLSPREALYLRKIYGREITLPDDIANLSVAELEQLAANGRERISPVKAKRSFVDILGGILKRLF